MLGIQITIQPTAGLTFRRLPGSILHIATYPFLPPTTMSGFLRRLAIMKNADQSFDISVLVRHQETNREMYVLPRGLIAVGAYPEPLGASSVHTTKRQGIRSFKHDAFSRIYRTAAQKEVYQLHDWDYLMCEKMTGYVLCEREVELVELTKLSNYGCKLGKEGFAFVSQVSEPCEFRLEQATAMPATVVPGGQLVGIPCEAFPLYRYAWRERRNDHLGSLTPSPVAGFIPFMAGLPKLPLRADYYTDGKAFIPKALVEELTRGES